MQAKAAARQEEGDEMIISAGDFLIRALKPAAARLHWERVALVTLAGATLGESLALHCLPVAIMRCFPCSTLLRLKLDSEKLLLLQHMLLQCAAKISLSFWEEP